ncbi:uncharacterized protein LOC116412953 [Galleria mellonella]|uniref:Uncharacterized protein LOC116412953 n=1 Tax=Galleria mellonella TaxID=7137 RepID=A0ABM3MEK5_GALME|nr:uncharacterized protein LOC116412953 [Galleria mellonella]
MNVQVLIFLHIVLIVVDAELSIFSKPVVNLYTNPMTTTTQKLPDIRQKQLIFPMKLGKFVITSKPHSNMQMYTPRSTMMTKMFQMKNIKSYIEKSVQTEFIPVTRLTLLKSMEFTVNPFIEQIPRQIVDRKLNVILKDQVKSEGPQDHIRDDNKIFEKSDVNNDDWDIATDVVDIFEEDLSETDSQINEESTHEKLNTELPIQGLGKGTYWSNVHVPSDTSNEIIDNSEFIFIKDLGKITNKDQLLDNVTK